MRSQYIVVLGGGESGVGAAVLAMKKGFRLFLSDSSFLKPEYRAILIENEIDFEEGTHSIEKILSADEIVKSPGIPDSVSIVKQAREKGIPIISEIEFAARFTKAKLICVTGSNGKTTTALLLHHIFTNAGYDIGLAGNIGASFALQVAQKDRKYFVLEISSFQLDGMFDFRADIAVITNITPDHLDRYNNNFEEYIQSKLRIVRNQTEKDTVIFCFDDSLLKERISKQNCRAEIFPFSIKEKLTRGAWIEDNSMIVKTNSKNSFNMILEKLALQGKHNTYNSMAAAVAARVGNVRSNVLKESLNSFGVIEHRLEPVSNVQGVSFVNDSKATNVNSTWYALDSVSTPIVWIAGGVDKGNDYSGLSTMVRQKVKLLICLGKDNKKLRDAFSDYVENICETESMDIAVETALHYGEKGDTVLLSPACASFDLFENFEARGEAFKNAVQNL